LNLPESGLRRFHHDLRGSVSNLRIALEACLRDPALLGPLGPEMLNQLGQLQCRLAQQNLLSKTLFPLSPVALDQLLTRWFQQGELALEPSVVKSPVRVDPDLLWGVVEEVQRNAELWAQGLRHIELCPSEQGWVLRFEDQGPGWPEGLLNWLEGEDWVWKGQLRLGLRLVSELATALGARLRLESAPEGSCTCLYFAGGHDEY
jgi:hypothetical protein